MAEWPELEQAIRDQDDETAAWSRQELGKDIYHFANSVSIAQRSLDVLDEALSVSPPDEPVTKKFQAVRIQLEYAFKRLLNAWRLLLEGYHSDARNLQRIAWEAENRAAYYLTCEGTGERFLEGEEVREGTVRKELNNYYKKHFPELWNTQGDVLTGQWNKLSTYSHVYQLGVVHLQATVDGQLVTLRQTGVRKRNELYVSMALNGWLTQRIARTLAHEISELEQWPDELSTHIEKADQERKDLEAQIQTEFPLPDKPNPPL